MNEPPNSAEQPVAAASPPRFPHRGPGYGMLISLRVVLDRAAETCQRSRDMKHLEHRLRQLKEHINMLRAAKSDEEALDLLDRFLALWVDD